MRRGCIAMQEVICDSCHRTIQPAERYLAVDEEKKAEVEKGKTKHYCTDCALKKDYAYYKEEKGEKILTFFPKSY